MPNSIAPSQRGSVLRWSRSVFAGSSLTLGQIADACVYVGGGD
jgi:hypothetical protein